MKKVIVIFILVILIIIGVVVVMKLNTNISKEYTKLNIADETKKMAIFYIGADKNSYDYSLVDKCFGDTSKYKTVDVGGSERYLIVPKHTDYMTKVYSLSLNDEGKQTEKEVAELAGPFFLNCNSSDIFANSKIVIKTKDKEYSYSPYFSLRDGSLVISDFVQFVTNIFTYDI